LASKNKEECAVFTTTAEGVMEKKASVVDMMAVKMESKISDAATMLEGTQERTSRVADAWANMVCPPT
jgi:hypothetical protein